MAGPNDGWANRFERPGQVARHYVALLESNPVAAQRFRLWVNETNPAGAATAQGWLRVEGLERSLSRHNAKAAFPLASQVSFDASTDDGRRSLPSVTYLSDVGLVAFLDDGPHTIGESVGHRSPFRFGGNVRRPQNAVHMPRAIVLPWRRRTNYFHTIFDVLPLVVRAIELEPSTPIIVPSGNESVLRQLLDVLGCEASLVCRPGDVLLGSAVSLSPTGDRGLPSIRSRLRRLLPSAATGPAKLYLSRRRVENRPLDNEEQIEGMLTGRGFRVVSLEELSLIEQLQLVSDAEVVVGPHGAAMANMVAARTDVALVELQPDFYQPNIIAVFGKMLGCDWSRTTVVGPATSRALRPESRRSWRVDPDEVLDAVDAV